MSKPQKHTKIYALILEFFFFLAFLLNGFIHHMSIIDFYTAMLITEVWKFYIIKYK